MITFEDRCWLSHISGGISYKAILFDPSVSQEVWANAVGQKINRWRSQRFKG